MKKKLMMVAVLLGALSLGACVDDNESQSVTDLRNAKAAQLEALANLYNAQAEAERIIADAEAALKQAKAQYQAALATAKEQETARLAEKHAIEIEKLKAQAEAAIALAKKNAAKYEQDLIDQAGDYIRALYSDYQDALNIMYDYQERKIELTTDIAKAEAELVPAKELMDNQIARYNKQIAEYEYTISLYEEYEGADLATLKQDLAKAKKDLDVASDTNNKAVAAQNEAFDAYWAQVDRFDPDEVYNVQNPIATIKAVKQLWEKGWYVEASESRELSDNYDLNYYTLNPASVVSQRQNLENTVEYYTNQLGATTDAANEYGSLNAQKKYWEAEKADKLEADADADVTYEQNKIDLLTARITEYTGYLTNAKENLTLFESLVDAFEGDALKAYDEAFAAQKALAEDWEKKHDEYVAANDAYVAAYNKVSTLNTLIYQTDVEERIAYYNDQINNLKKDIASAQEDYNNGYDDVLELYNAELDKVNDQIEYQQAIIDSLQQQIQAYLESEGTEETPDTPAEDTPSEEQPAA